MGGAGVWYQCVRLPINFWSAYSSRPSKEKAIQKWAGIMVKSGKIIELKRRAAKFHKSSIAFWGKAVSQSGNKQKPAVTQSMDITDLEITSILL